MLDYFFHFTELAYLASSKTVKFYPKLDFCLNITYKTIHYVRIDKFYFCLFYSYAVIRTLIALFCLIIVDDMYRFEEANILRAISRVNKYPRLCHFCPWCLSKTCFTAN